MVTKEEVEELLDYNPETGEFFWKVSIGARARLGRKAGSVQKHTNLKDLCYRRIQIKGRRYQAHQLAFLIMKGYFPDDNIDHIDQNGLNNRWHNLREVTHQENQKNISLRKNNTSGQTGVSFSKLMGKWGSRITLDGKDVHLGYFENYEDAVKVRKEAEPVYGYHPNHGRKRETV